MTGPRTYWHLEGLGRRPSNYDIATTRLLYHPERGFAIETPVAAWYRTHHAGARLESGDWDAFDDPRATTYASYTAERRDREVFVDRLLASAEAAGYEDRLAPGWLATLARVLGPLRYPVHGLQMAAAYLGSMAPSGKLAALCLFLAADEMRFVQRLAYRMGQIQTTHAGFFDESLSVWLEDPAWQPMRELIERLLVAYDFSDAFVGLSFVVKPVLDDVFLNHFGERARRAGDGVLEKMFDSLRDDSSFHTEWSSALARHLGDQSLANIKAMDAAIDRWWPLAVRAIGALAPFCDPASESNGQTPLACKVEQVVKGHWSLAGLRSGSGPGRGLEA